jgi:hypothetical protein
MSIVSVALLFIRWWHPPTHISILLYGKKNPVYHRFFSPNHIISHNKKKLRTKKIGKWKYLCYDLIWSFATLQYSISFWRKMCAIQNHFKKLIENIFFILFNCFWLISSLMLGIARTESANEHNHPMLLLLGVYVIQPCNVFLWWNGKV